MPPPMSPPINAWEDEDGSPNHHVTRFQTIAPSSAASTTFWVPAPVSRMPLLIVLATAVEVNAPTKFITAAMATASRGDRARVDTEVATALAVSWKPLVK